MFFVLNCDSRSANHTSGLVGQNCGTLMDTALTESILWVLLDEAVCRARSSAASAVISEVSRGMMFLLSGSPM